MKKLQGKDLILYITAEGGTSYTRIALSTTCSLDVATELREVSSLFTGKHKSYRPGRYSWTVRCDSLVAVENYQPLDLLLSQLQGQKLLVTMNIENTRRYGYVYITGWSETGDLGSMLKYSTTMTGTGPLNIEGGTAVTNISE